MAPMSRQSISLKMVELACKPGVFKTAKPPLEPYPQACIFVCELLEGFRVPFVIKDDTTLVSFPGVGPAHPGPIGPNPVRLSSSTCSLAYPGRSTWIEYVVCRVVLK